MTKLRDLDARGAHLPSVGTVYTYLQTAKRAIQEPPALVVAVVVQRRYENAAVTSN